MCVLYILILCKMGRNTMLEFYHVVLFVTSFICVTAMWLNTYSTAHYSLISFPNSMELNEDLIFNETDAMTVTSCALFCAIQESVSLYYNVEENICFCNTKFDTRFVHGDLADDSSGDNGIIYGYIVSSLQISSNTSTVKYVIQPYKEDCLALNQHGYKTNAVYTVQQADGSIQDVVCDMDLLAVGADDCLHWLQLGYSADGVYTIRLSNGTSVKALCNQTGGGWTVIQRRQDGSVDFYRPWADYVNGFGDPEGEYWLGLEVIYLLTQNPSSLRIDMETFGDVTPITTYALYDTFSLSSAADKYRLSIGALTGDCGDSMGYHNGRQFSTLDSDNDNLEGTNCAIFSRGAWWYRSCYHSNLNGIYYMYGSDQSDASDGVYWHTCWTIGYSLKACALGVKRNEPY